MWLICYVFENIALKIHEMQEFCFKPRDFEMGLNWKLLEKINAEFCALCKYVIKKRKFCRYVIFFTLFAVKTNTEWTAYNFNPTFWRPNFSVFFGSDSTENIPHMYTWSTYTVFNIDSREIIWYKLFTIFHVFRCSCSIF